MKTPTIYYEHIFREGYASGVQTCVSHNGLKVWTNARPINYDRGIWYRLKCAWLVATGRADVLVWEGQE